MLGTILPAATAGVSVIGDGTVNWGFGSTDIWQNAMVVVGSLSGFLILGIAIKFAPKLFSVIKSALFGGGKA